MRFEKAELLFEPEAQRAWAERFSPARFDAAFDLELEAVLGFAPARSGAGS